MRNRVLVAALALWVGALLTSPALPGRAEEVDGKLVVAAVRVLEQHYYKPVDAVALLNSAIASLRSATGLGSDALPDLPPGTGEGQAGALFQQRFDRAARAGKMSTADLAYSTIKVMLSSLHDVDTSYYTPVEYSELKQRFAGAASFGGLGISIQEEKDAAGVGWTFIVDVYPDSPAEVAGLKPFDKILEVAGHTIRDMATTDVSALLRGQPGSAVSLVVQRGNQRLPISVVRAPIRLLPRVAMIKPGVVYVRVYYFATGTGDQVRQALRAQMSHGPIRAVILDVRGTQGGWRSEQQSVAGIFLPSRTAIGRLIQHGGVSPVLVSGESLLTSAPMSALFDRSTTTNALVVGLKAVGRVTTIGETSRGVGGFGGNFDLPTGGLHLTTQMMVGPHDEPIQGVDVVPDSAIALTEADMERGVDTQLEAAVAAVAK